ncbi:unnamed protein product [Linum trigynum]|uniref:Uncharacterized protein n=1 Tax=Linum trigynum TaxID=586398 RepID=A0AAV2EXD7_9ROSI
MQDLLEKSAYPAIADLSSGEFLNNHPSIPFKTYLPQSCLSTPMNSIAEREHLNNQRVINDTKLNTPRPYHQPDWRQDNHPSRRMGITSGSAIPPTNE